MDSKDTCCFGPLRTDIQTGAFLVAFLGIILSFLGAIIYFLPSAEWHEHDPAMGFASLFSAVLYGAVIYGQKKGKPIFYVPYFILEALDILYYFFLALTLIARAISPSEDLIKQFGKENPASTNPEKDLRDHYLVECFTLLLGNTLSVYFFWVIWKSYKKTKEQIGQNGGGHQQFANCV